MKLKDLIPDDEDGPIVEMANISRKATGLPFSLWFDVVERKTKHGTRFKILTNEGDISISFDGKVLSPIPPNVNKKQLKLVINFVMSRIEYVKKYYIEGGKVKNGDPVYSTHEFINDMLK